MGDNGENEAGQRQRDSSNDPECGEHNLVPESDKAGELSYVPDEWQIFESLSEAEGLLRKGAGLGYMIIGNPSCHLLPPADELIAPWKKDLDDRLRSFVCSIFGAFGTSEVSKLEFVVYGSRLIRKSFTNRFSEFVAQAERAKGLESSESRVKLLISMMVIYLLKQGISSENKCMEADNKKDLLRSTDRTILGYSSLLED